MMISDAELLKLVMDRYPEQPAQFLIEQFTVMKAGLIQANNKLAGMDSEALSESLCCAEDAQKEETVSEPSAPKKKIHSPQSGGETGRSYLRTGNRLLHLR